MDQLQQQQSSREFKVEGASMPKFHGKPQESVDEFIFEAKLFMNGKNIDYHHPGNQARVVAMLASNLRDGAASWYHSRIMIDNEPISSIDNFEEALRDEFLPPDQQHRLRAALRACKQTSDVEEYVSRFRKIITQIRDMSALDKVDHFITGLKPDTRKEVDYLNCNSLKTAISAAQAYERAHFGAARRQTAARRDGPEPMDISQVTTRPTVEQCRRQGLCFYCRKPGHRISDCPKKRQGNEGAQRM
ncbi:hypothetical protein F444_02319 [Phytophthora nicotianae P1976]|uniref:CCHC-type domain-containing protein n=1 Tax=Phytophthora nicotianae P1976 TaxID=1317066 RepID=A0A081AXU1_PHYNI|nr:hypothetical protein F444_02319 [Phytophthora nicotianae P1976]